MISDSTGNLPRHMLTAFLTQFPRDLYEIHHFNFVREAAKLEACLEWIQRAPGIVFHAVVTPAVKQTIARQCDRLGLPHCDLTGQFVQFLSSHLQAQPAADFRRLHRVDESYHRRIRAMEFTIQHDDGLGLETVGEADVVLAGISRTSKTPTSIYIAQQGFRAANYAMALGIEPPQQVLALPPRKVVGLTIHPHHLVEIRSRRRASWRMGETDYDDLSHVQQELAWSLRIFRRQGWHVLDVTDQAIEETAGRVLNLLGLDTRPRAHHP